MDTGVKMSGGAAAERGAAGGARREGEPRAGGVVGSADQKETGRAATARCRG